MAGLGDKIKNLTSLLNKGGKNKSSNSLFSGNTDPFSNAPPGLGVVPDLKAGIPPLQGVSSPSGMLPGLASPPGGFPPGMQPAAEKPSVDAAVLEASNKKIKELEGKLSKAEVNLSMVQKENEEMNKTVSKMDKNILELLSLYEIVSNQVNPFVGDDVGGRATLERFDKTEKRINEVGNILVMLKNDMDSFSQRLSSPGLAESVSEKMQDMETKFDAFADAMAMMHENINTISAKAEEFSEKNTLIDKSVMELSEVINSLALKVQDIEKNGAKMKQSPDQVVNSAEPVISEESNLIDLEKPKEKNPLVRLNVILKDPTSVVVLLNWIEFLMERVGRNNLMDALDYYVDIGWISDNVRSEIMAYARGIDYYVEKPTWRLLPEDHTKSLLFIERLCGRKIDKNMLSSIDREMSKVKHGLEELYGL